MNPEPLSSGSLRDVVAIGKQIQNSDISISVLTLERYTTGFAINVRLDWTGPTGPMPQLRWQVSDGQSTVFTGGGCGGSGGGERPNIRLIYLASLLPVIGGKLIRRLEDRPRGHSWRMHCSFWPAIAVEATELTLAATALGLSRPVLSQTEPDTIDCWESARNVANVGHIAVPLQPVPRSE